MATHLALDPALVDRAVAVSGEPSRKTAVTLAIKKSIPGASSAVSPSCRVNSTGMTVTITRPSAAASERVCRHGRLVVSSG